MPDIKFNCPACKQSLEAPPDMAGQLIDCPTCKGAIEIPFPPKPVVTPSASRPVAPTPRPAPRLQPAPPPPQPATQQTAYIKKKTEVVGIGCLVQGLGLVLCFLFFPIGLIAGLIVLVIGGRMAIKLVCSACGNKLEDKEVKICPVCKAALRPR